MSRWQEANSSARFLLWEKLPVFDSTFGFPLIREETVPSFLNWIVHLPYSARFAGKPLDNQSPVTKNDE
jgi:hypothetical protein